MAVDDNYEFLCNTISPEYHYLLEITGKPENKERIANYIDLFCATDVDDCDLVPDTVSNVFLKEKNFVLTGDPGSGKTTSLRFLFCNYALKISGHYSPADQIPVFLSAHEYSTEIGFLDNIQPAPEKEWFGEALKQDRIVFFIDGINEIDENLKLPALKELHSLMNQYAACRFILFIKRTSIQPYRQAPGV